MIFRKVRIPFHGSVLDLSQRSNCLNFRSYNWLTYGHWNVPILLLQQRTAYLCNSAWSDPCSCTSFVLPKGSDDLHFMFYDGPSRRLQHGSAYME